MNVTTGCQSRQFASQGRFLTELKGVAEENPTEIHQIAALHTKAIVIHNQTNQPT